MSEKTVNHTLPKPAERVYYIDDTQSSPTIHAGDVTNRYGSSVVVKRPLVGGSVYSIEDVHHTKVFTVDQVAKIAAELLPAIEPGDETTLQSAVEQVVHNQDINRDLAIRLAGAALANFATKPRTPEELGLLSVDELIGDEQIRGSNAWMIQDLISGYKDRIYPEGSSGALKLSRATEDISVLPQNVAAEIMKQIEDNNTQALSVLYDRFGVDFQESLVYESTDDKNKIIRKTVYPAPTNGISFVETAIIDIFSPASEKRSLDVSVVVGTPTFRLENGFYPAP